MTTDAEYIALAERLASGETNWMPDGAYSLTCAASSSAILALLEERDAHKSSADNFYAKWHAALARANLAESRLGKAVDLLQRTINGPVSADTHEKEWALFDETMAFLSDLEKSE